MSATVESPVSLGLLSGALADQRGPPRLPSGGLTLAAAMSGSPLGGGPPLQHLSLRKRTKKEVCEAFLATLGARGHPGAGDADFCGSVHRHFQSLPTRYALDVNIRSLDVLNHKRLLDAARADPNAISFQVRHVDVVVLNNPHDTPAERRPSFASLEMLEQAVSHQSHAIPIRGRSLPRPAFGSSPNLQALAAEVEAREQQEEAMRSAAETQFYEVTFASADQPKLLSKLSEALGDMALNICEAHAFNTTDRLVLDVFVVNGWGGADAAELEEMLGKRLQAMPGPVSAHSQQALLQAQQQAEPQQIQQPRPNSVASVNRVPMEAEPAPSRASEEAPTSSAPVHSDDWELDPSDITFHAKVASGAFGDLYKGSYCGQEVAIKVLRNVQDDSQQYQEFLQEVSIMRKVRHRNVVQFIGACTVKPNLCIVFEFMPCGSVYDYMRKNGPLKMPHVMKTALEVARGMDYLHKRRIVHRDLKAANLLLDESGTVKIADFGVARVLDPHGVMTAETGTYRWMAPEVIEHNPYREKADVYSYGIVLWELITGQVPYAELTPLQAAVGVVQKGLRPQLPPNCPSALADVMRSCWARNPDARPTFHDLKERLEELWAAGQKAEEAKATQASHAKSGFFAKFGKGSGRKL